jgi:hypothetical protein
MGRFERRRSETIVMRAATLYISQILAWADAYHKRTGIWPNLYSGRVWGKKDDTWRRVDSALRLGLRGLPGGSSLARLLAARRGVRNSTCLPHLTLKQILTWADDHLAKTGSWPKETSGAIAGANGETWFAVDRALRAGVRGFAGGSSLPQILARHRHVRNIQKLHPLTIKKILQWADAHQRRNARWPMSHSGRVTNADGETWSGINTALQAGRRGMPGGSSLARVLAKYRGVRNPKDPPALTENQILTWAKQYQRRHGLWPNRNSGPIEKVPGETWAMIDRALRNRQRGLHWGSSLFRLLKKHFNISKRQVTAAERQ